MQVFSGLGRVQGDRGPLFSRNGSQLKLMGEGDGLANLGQVLAIWEHFLVFDHCLFCGLLMTSIPSRAHRA